MAKTYFKERAVSKRAWIILLVLCAIGWGYFFFIGSVMKAIFAGGALIASTGGIAALTMWSMNHYGNIVVTDKALRVGRATVPLSDLDPEDVRSANELLTPGVTERLAAAGTFQLPGQRQALGGGELIGGGYAAPIGKRIVQLRRRQAGPINVPVQDAPGLLAGLHAALTGRP